jgi:hypothetical protein
MKDVQTLETVGGYRAPRIRKTIKIDNATAEASFWALGKRMRESARILKADIWSLHNQPQTEFDSKYRTPESVERLKSELRSLAAMRRKFSAFVWPSLYAGGYL